MFSADLAEVYEMIYRSRGKDWTAEARDVAREIRARKPDAASLLDVACGTGAHLKTFGEVFQDTEGLEIAEPMRELAARRLPEVKVHAGDMRAFELGRTFDTVVCLFCAIGYLSEVEDMRSAVAAMARHLVPGGVLVIEPWWFPEDFIEGYVAGDLAQENGMTVTRVSHSTLQGRATRMEVRFVVGDRSGIREFTEVDVLSLWTKEEYLDAFRAAGCTAEFLPGGPTGRGLFIGTLS
ncbi:class I SAM-dependent methyltransferase [Streptomyces sp. Li-HN-5-11]|uniref:class I SAM-dependent methyltransferase n=1 Tax=Streptomyces sp. Li-HN-5-11 TaxID=3075432 RepID=UPI0028A8F464|nr:class I SAM-dependent methyltransferase [Streptomyces sp. Li-HN-5-11]WNM31368.1 class I SAM-dependent methyltransferase [Streptomyces sp. Li-HN-5-11]